MGFALVMLALTSLATALLLVPLILRQRPAASSDGYNLAVYRDQLAEIERDVGRGLVSPAEAEAARAEIGRRILALPAGAPAARPPLRGLLGVATACVLLLPFAAWGLYWQLGSPSLPDEPIAARRAGGPEMAGADPHLDMPSAIARLAAHLREHPDDLDGWMLLGRSDLDVGQYRQAVEAYRRAVELSNRRLDIVGDLGEALVLAAGGTVTPAAREAFEAALKDPETAPRSRYYLGLYDLQQGNAKAALQAWVDLEADSPEDANWLPLLRRRIAETAALLGLDPANLKTSSGKGRPAQPAAEAPTASAPPAAPEAGPSNAEVTAVARATAGATPEQREAMIRGMVANLAAKLQEHPDDAEGWVRLGRSYMVLSEPGKAADAYARAVKLRPDDPALKTAYAEAVAASGGGK
jgi:cytochrome c-type biogenesis protein CcmH